MCDDPKFAAMCMDSFNLAGSKIIPLYFDGLASPGPMRQQIISMEVMIFGMIDGSAFIICIELDAISSLGSVYVKLDLQSDFCEVIMSMFHF
jgi:hypothetical protein